MDGAPCPSILQDDKDVVLAAVLLQRLCHLPATGYETTRMWCSRHVHHGYDLKYASDG